MTNHEVETIAVKANGFGAGQLVLAALGGAVAGAVAGLLLAPASGTETRDAMRRVAVRTKDQIAHLPKAIRDAGMAAKEAFVEEERKVAVGSGNGKGSIWPEG